MFWFFFSSRRRHTRCALVTGVQTCALPICIDGTDGKLVEFVWKRAATVPAAPAGNGIPAGWSDDPPVGSDPLWMSKAKQELDGTLVAGEIGRASCRERVCQYV